MKNLEAHAEFRRQVMELVTKHGLTMPEAAAQVARDDAKLAERCRLQGTITERPFLPMHVR